VEEITQANKPYTLSMIILIAFIIGFILILSFYNYKYLTDSSVNVTLSFQDAKQASIFDEKLIVNILQSLPGFKILSENFTSSLRLNISDLTDANSGTMIYSKDIFLTNKSKPNKIDSQHPLVVDFIINVSNPLKFGEYDGGMFITDGFNNTSIPVTLKVTPPITQAIILVIDGIVISIAFWKVIAFLNYIVSRDIDKNASRSLYFGSTMLKFTKENKIGALKYITYKSVIGKNVLLDTGTIVFGILVGLIALPVNSTLNIESLDYIEIMTLLGSGLAIGSLKEFIPKLG